MADLTIPEFLAKWAVASAETALALHVGLDAAAQMVETTAKESIGTYQEAIGPFPGWAALAPGTEEYKRRMGFPENAPLLATGEMRDSISHQTEAFEALIGSPEELLLWHEVGTSRMPPRPVLGPAVLHNVEQIQSLLGAAIVSGIAGRHALPDIYERLLK